MDPSELWQKWARTLQQNHLTGIAITLLEGAAPVRMILSQTLFGLSPFFNSVQKNSLHAFAETLDDTVESNSFASFLKSGETDE